jgi:hypothetical protein
MARIGLRMMPPFPWSPLKFRKAGFPRYGFKAGMSDGPYRRLRVLRDVRLPPPFVHLAACSVVSRL